MRLPHDTMIAVADGENLHIFRSVGNEDRPRLQPAGHPAVDGTNHSSGNHHRSSSANPDEKQGAEDSYAAATAALLNQQAIGEAFEHAVVIAPPKTLGELRKHYHKAFSSKILKEIPKEMTGQMIDQIAAAIEHA